MPSIPYTDTLNPKIDESNAPLLNVQASPNDFGAGIGEAMQRFGSEGEQDASQVGRLLKINENLKRKEDVANNLALFDPTKSVLAAQQQVPANGDGYSDLVTQNVQKQIDDHANTITDDKTREMFRTRAEQNLVDIQKQSEVWQAGQAAAFGKGQAEAGINSLQNRISTQPQNYDQLYQQGADVINARPDINPGVKAGMVQTWGYNSARARFDGLITNAQNVTQLDGIANELVNPDGKGRDWQSKLLPGDFNYLSNAIGTARSNMQKSNDTNANAAVTALDERNKDTTRVVPTQELQQYQQTAAQTDDPNIQQKMARAMRDQSIIRTENRLPPDEMRARINAADGNPGLAYPGLPQPVSDGINEAAAAKGVSAGYLGGLATREYGANFKKAPVTPDTAFAPQVAHSGLDLRNINSEAVNAATQAGKALGTPLVLTKGNPGSDEAVGSGISISTAGRSEADKAKLVGALVNAGFTGVAENPNDIRVSMRTAVPKDFGKDGSAWGGWTNLSPEVMKALQDKGFKGGADSTSIQRALPPPAPSIDYGQPTSIKDATGKPTSSAMGVAQFTQGTWRDVMATPDMKAYMLKQGTDVSKLSDQQLLDLRKDPKTSMMAAATYAAQNKSILEDTLGRPVNDAEVYMAHLMGATGATAFLNGYKNKPTQSAAALAPDAAASNPNVFYLKGDKDKPLTTQAVYNNISQSFNLSPDRVAFEDNKTRQRILENTEKGLNADPISQAASVGSHVITPLSTEGGFQARGTQAAAVAQYYNIPMDKMKPFTVDENNYLKSEFDKGDTQNSMKLLGSVASMGNTMATQAMKQIGDKDPVMGRVGELYLAGHSPEAQTIMMGANALKQDPKLKDQFGVHDEGISNSFVSVTGGALANLPPQDLKATQDAALAYYAQSALSSGTLGKGSWRGSMYKEGVNAALGGTTKNDVIDTMNGRSTLLPTGIDGKTLEAAVHNMNLDDWTRMSDGRTPPRYANGAAVNPVDINRDVIMKAIGGGSYRLATPDGGVVMTDGNKPFIFKPDVKDLRNVAARPSLAANQASFGSWVLH